MGLTGSGHLESLSTGLYMRSFFPSPVWWPWGLTGERLTSHCKEYFEKLTDKTSWGKRDSLLGAFHMQEALGLGAIGGKDSMSSTFNDIHVPPTLVSFAIAPGKASEAVNQELKKEGDVLGTLRYA